ncbi:unnamed protein product [Adineta ricciae]|uniref:RIB43A-like with coiled-coils protein 2 n=1 Tax=Adineta ricciae TaxID=249248 RepID=A0A815DQH8_ADIRI|nr:unnamed protein product [Adineta ricciae]CAF1304253.1 unnamed protein product [Adineta ricciae]
MFLRNLPIDIREQAAVERRRRQEKERLSRIFNVKYRTIGVDRVALDEQIQERERLKQFERQRNDAFDCEMIRNDFKLISLEQDELSQQRQYAQDLNDYRRMYQRPEDAREWDLNDPNRWKYLTPTRVKDDDARLGLSSAQIFTGEDLQQSARKKAQQEQLKNDFDIQIMAKIRKVERERLASHLYDCKQLELSERGNMFEQIENECYRAMQLATRNYNEILANETKIRHNERKCQQTEEQLAELGTTVFSDMLTENIKDVLDARGRIIVDRWKGMTKDQLDDIRHQQLTQIAERRKLDHTQKNFDEIWGKYANAIAKQEIITEQKVKDDHRQSCRHLADENQHLSRKQRAYQDYLNTNLYRSVPTAAFYTQFNTSSR